MDTVCLEQGWQRRAGAVPLCAGDVERKVSTTRGGPQSAEWDRPSAVLHNNVRRSVEGAAPRAGPGRAGASRSSENGAEVHTRVCRAASVCTSTWPRALAAASARL